MIQREREKRREKTEKEANKIECDQTVAPRWHQKYIRKPVKE